MNEAPRFRFGVKPGSVYQPCTFCGAAGVWTLAGPAGEFTPPIGHEIRSDGTLHCPRASVRITTLTAATPDRATGMMLAPLALMANVRFGCIIVIAR